MGLTALLSSTLRRIGWRLLWLITEPPDEGGHMTDQGEFAGGNPPRDPEWGSISPTPEDDQAEAAAVETEGHDAGHTDEPQPAGYTEESDPE